MRSKLPTLRSEKRTGRFQPLGILFCAMLGIIALCAGVFGADIAIVSAAAEIDAPAETGAKTAGIESVKVSWSTVSGADGYAVYRAESKGGAYEKLAVAPGGAATSYTDKKLPTGKTYYYQVCAYVQQGGQAIYGPSGPVASAKAAPLPPQKVKAEADNRLGICLTWKKVSGADGYEVFRASSKEGKYSKIKTIAKGKNVNYTDEAITKYKTFYYKVRAYKTVQGKKVCGAYGDTASAKPKRVIDPKKPMVALTFDDGPSKVTPKILNLLKKYGGKATFCMVGSRVKPYAKVVKRVAKEGHEVASHTWTHSNLTRLSNTQIKNELKRTNSAIKKLTGYDVKMLRAPYGAVNGRVKSVCKSMGMYACNWSVDTLDWKTRNAKKTVKAVTKDVKDGSIILCHDLYTQTGEAMATVIPRLVKKGYQLVTVSELLQYRKGDAKAGALYFHG